MDSPGDSTRDLNDVPLNIRIPEQLKERLEAYSAENGQSQAAVTRQALNAFLTEHGHPRRPAL